MVTTSFILALDDSRGQGEDWRKAPMGLRPSYRVPRATVAFDGARRKSGLGTGAALLYATRSVRPLLRRAQQWDRPVTSNESEYLALMLGLELAREVSPYALRVVGDSKLVIMQMRGSWRCHEPHLRRLRCRAQRMVRDLGLDSVRFVWRPRENRRCRAADRLAASAWKE